jgi:hypothetical protein
MFAVTLQLPSDRKWRKLMPRVPEMARPRLRRVTSKMNPWSARLPRIAHEAPRIVAGGRPARVTGGAVWRFAYGGVRTRGGFIAVAAP